MNVIKTVFGIGYCALLAVGLHAQPDSLRQHAERSYGLDQHLVNGTLFYEAPTLTAGHPYLGTADFVQGKVLIGHQWHPTPLKYDIYKQALVIEYRDLNGAPMQLRPVMDHLEAFYLGSLEFCQKQEEGRERIYQQVDFWGQRCLVHWTKRLDPVSNQTAVLEQFSDARPSFFLEVDGRLEPFSSKRSFSKLFPPSRQKQVRSFLIRRQFSFRRSSAQELSKTLLALEHHLNQAQP